MFNLQLTEIDFSSRFLGDSGVRDILDNMKEYIGVLDLSTNNLMEMPSLIGFETLTTLKRVTLAGNQIGSFFWQSFPPQTTAIDFS